MNDEIINKISKNASASPLEEARVQHIFTLARKLIERVPRSERQEYALLKFYCDWTLHSKIDRSEVGALIIRRIHDAVVNNLKPTSPHLADELTAILSLEEVRNQLNKLILRFGGRSDMFSQAKWNELVLLLLEIVSHCALMIGKYSWLEKIRTAIQAKPLKGASVVTKLAIIKVPTQTFDPGAVTGLVTFCMLIDTTDTIKIVVPLIKAGIT